MPLLLYAAYLARSRIFGGCTGEPSRGRYWLQNLPTYLSPTEVAWCHHPREDPQLKYPYQTKRYEPMKRRVYFLQTSNQ